MKRALIDPWRDPRLNRLTMKAWRRAILLAFLARSGEWFALRDLGAALAVDQTSLGSAARELVAASYVEERRQRRPVGVPVAAYRAMEIARAAQR